MFRPHCKNGKISTKHQVGKGVLTIRGFSPISGIFSQYEILISLKCAFDSESNGVIYSVVSCLTVELIIH